MTNLKPCPFCGGEAEINREQDIHLDCEIVWVECKECNAKSKFYAIGVHKIPPRAKMSDDCFAPVRYAWNRRAEE